MTDHQTDYEVQVPEEIGGDGINKALVERNKKVESMYNITIVEERNPNGNSDGYPFLDSASASGDYFGDIYSNYVRQMINSHSVAGFYLNLCDLKSLRLDKEWWDQDFLSEMMINNHVYTVTGDIQTNDDLHERNLTINMDLYSRTYPEKNIYNIIVRDRTWTFEELYNTWYNFGTRDLGIQGKVEDDDIVGFYYDCRTASYFYMASGLKAFTVENNKPVLSIASDKALRIMDHLQKIVDGNCGGLKTACQDRGGGGSYAYAAQHFAAGKVLMTSATLAAGVSSYGEMEQTLVYAPFPKYDLAQDCYYSLVHMSFEAMAISANVEDPERTALITEALAFYSDALEYEVVKVLIKERMSEELETREILQMTLDSKVYDLEYTAEIMGWTVIVNDELFVGNQLSSYKSRMDALARTAVRGSGGGTLERFLSVYADLNFRK